MADFTIADVLDEARALVERGWCQIYRAQNASGESVSEDSPDAVRWCVTGAISHTAKGAKDYYGAWKAACAAVEQTVGRYQTVWNDTPGRTQVEVVQALRDAAARLRAQSAEPLSDTWTKADAYLTDIEDVARERVTA